MKKQSKHALFTLFIAGLAGCEPGWSSLPTTINHVDITITSSIGRCGTQLSCTTPEGCETNPDRVITATLRAHKPLIQGYQRIVARMFLIQDNKIADWVCPPQIKKNSWTTMGVIKGCAIARNGQQFTAGKFQFMIEGGIYEWDRYGRLLGADKRILQSFIGNFTNREIPCPRF